jgi:hypothetical protein
MVCWLGLMQKLILQCLNEGKIVASVKSEKMDNGYEASDRENNSYAF